MSSGFITEGEIAEARKKRQEEWEKVRKPEDPLERPEEPYDSRPLYERLKEQQMKKDLEYEEAHKLKNLIRGLDDDEIEFLDMVDRTKAKVEKQQQIEEEKELNEFRQRVATLQENSLNNKIETETLKVNQSKSKITQNASLRPSQKSLLGSVVRKRKVSDNGEQGTSNSDLSASSIRKENCNLNNLSPPTKKNIKRETTENESCSSPAKDKESLNKGALKCIAILPGIGRYKDSSDSELSSDSEEEADTCSKFDVFGRIAVRKKKNADDSE